MTQTRRFAILALSLALGAGSLALVPVAGAQIPPEYPPFDDLECSVEIVQSNPGVAADCTLLTGYLFVSIATGEVTGSSCSGSSRSCNFSCGPRQYIMVGATGAGGNVGGSCGGISAACTVPASGACDASKGRTGNGGSGLCVGTRTTPYTCAAGFVVLS